MKVRVGNEIFDTEKDPVVLIFETDKERIGVAEQISNMERIEGPRVYAQFPDGHPDVTRDYLIESLKLAGYVE